MANNAGPAVITAAHAATNVSPAVAVVTPTAAPTNASMTAYGPVPPPSTVIPGYHSLGQNTPVSAPANAVFAVPGGTDN